MFRFLKCNQSLGSEYRSSVGSPTEIYTNNRIIYANFYCTYNTASLRAKCTLSRIDNFKRKTVLINIPAPDARTILIKCVTSERKTMVRDFLRKCMTSLIVSLFPLLLFFFRGELFDFHVSRSTEFTAWKTSSIRC